MNNACNHCSDLYVLILSWQNVGAFYYIDTAACPRKLHNIVQTLSVFSSPSKFINKLWSTQPTVI